MSFDAEIADGLASIAAETGRKVKLQRRAITREITAVPGATRTITEVSENVRMQVKERDYVIQAELYRFPGDDVREPQPGDVIHDLGRRYEVSSRGDSVGCWQWSDRGHTRYRVHCLEIGGNCR